MESIKKLIQEGKTERVLTLILGNTSDASVTKEATLLMSRLKRWQLETRGGVISHADAQLEANKINAALLDLVNGLDPQIYNFPVNLADSADEKLDETAFPTDNVQPLNASKYVWISVVALLLSIILFVGLVY